MKTAIKLCLGLFTFFTFTGCMNSARLSVLKPADISVAQNIQKIVVANRSIASKENQVSNVIEGILTGEGIGQDRRASQDAILGVIAGLNDSPRFKSTQAVNTTLKGTGTSQMPSPLSWGEVERICADNYSDALLLLEVFDSDSKQWYSTRNVQKTINGEKVDVLEHIAHNKVIVTSGWRLYDPNNRTIIDDFKAEDYKEFTGRGENQKLAFGNLAPKERLLKETGYFAGENYSLRIAPRWVWVTRSYYAKGKDPDFKRAKLQARANQWKDAAIIWKSLAETSSFEKDRKKAAFNMALACEIEGKLDLAMEWAKKSLNYGNKKAIPYINTLKRRIADEERANYQMGQ
jgi:hypothetical protein